MNESNSFLWDALRGLAMAAFILVIVVGGIFYMPALIWIGLMILTVLVAIFVRLGKRESPTPKR